MELIVVCISLGFFVEGKPRCVDRGWWVVVKVKEQCSKYSDREA